MLCVHEAKIWSVAFSLDGQRIVSGSLDKTVWLWDISWKDLLPMACNQLRYHPSLNLPTMDVALEAKQTCEYPKPPNWIINPVFFDVDRSLAFVLQ